MKFLEIVVLFVAGAIWAWILMHGVVDHMQPVPTGWDNPASQQILVYGD